MILFYDSSGRLVYNSIPESLNQGSSKANEITIVGPFAPSSILTIDFWLPDGKTLGHSFVDSNSTEYKLAAAFAEGGGYRAPDGTVLYAWTYSVNSALTAVGGTLTFAVTVHTSDDEDIALDTVSIIINNGVPNIPDNPTIPQDAEDFYDKVLAYITGAANAMASAQEAAENAAAAQAAAEDAATDAEATLADTVKKNTEGSSSIEQTINSSIKITENLTVDGDFNVKGKTTIVDHETLTVNDNIIVTNAGDESPIDSLSGLVINTGELASDGISFKGYGIVFVPPLATNDNPNPDPSDGTVKLGLGTITRTADGLAEFAFDDGEAQTVATRDDFEDAASNIIPMWDAVKRSFVPSGMTTADFVPVNAPDSGFLPRYVFGLVELSNDGVNRTFGIRRIPVGNFGDAFGNSNTPIPAYFASSDGTPETTPGNSNDSLHLWTSDPTRPYHAVSKHYADASYVPIQTGSGTRVYTSTNGEQGFQYFAPQANPYYIVQRTPNGNIYLPDQITTPPNQDTFAISKGYGDAHYVPLNIAASTYAQIYGKESNGTNRMYNATASADAGTIPIRYTNGILLAAPLSTQIDVLNAAPENACISKGYANANYVALKTNTTTLNQVYAKTPSGEQTMVNMGVGAESGGIAVRDTSGQIRLPNQINTPPDNDNMAISKGYGNAHYVPLSRITPIYAHLVRLKAADLTTRVELTIYNTSSTPFTLADVESLIQPRINTWATYVNSATKKTMVFIASYVDNTLKFQMLDETLNSIIVESITDAVTMCFDSAISANATVEKVYRHKLQLYTDSDHLYTIVVYNTSNIPFTDVDTALSKVAFPMVATYSSYPENTHVATVISSANSLSALVSSVDDTVTPLSNLN